MATTRLMTVEDVERLPDDGYRYDLIDGALIRLTPAAGGHGEVAFEIAWHLGGFVRPRRLGRIYAAETGFILGRNPDVVLGPDVAFVREDRIPTDYDPDHFLPVAPDLAVEVISPSERHGQITTKVRKYLQGGVRLLWLVNPRRRTATVYSPGAEPRVLTEADELDGGDVLPGCRLPIAAIFR